jgi:hypothetical protein
MGLMDKQRIELFWMDRKKHPLIESYILPKALSKGRIKQSNCKKNTLKKSPENYQICQTLSVKLTRLPYCELLITPDPKKCGLCGQMYINSAWSILKLKWQASAELGGASHA